MINSTLALFYERDIRKLIEEVQLFNDEENLWRIKPGINNPAGNLVLHITGGTNYWIGTQLADIGYVRHRSQEFSARGVERKLLIAGLEALIPMVKQVCESTDLDAEFPIPFDDAKRTNGYLLLQLLAHLNYHLGQVNYLRRMLE